MSYSMQEPDLGWWEKEAPEEGCPSCGSAEIVLVDRKGDSLYMDCSDCGHD
jgi:hypothetical protein